MRNEVNYAKSSYMNMQRLGKRKQTGEDTEQDDTDNKAFQFPSALYNSVEVLALQFFRTWTLLSSSNLCTHSTPFLREARVA
jgi:hypothetical protein